MNNSQLAVYAALRNHILYKEREITDATIYMYVTFFALLAIGQIWTDWISLVSFLALIVFQSLINESIWEVIKASIYIRVFFEDSDKGVQWESLHVDLLYSSVRDAESRNLGWYIYQNGVSILSIVSMAYIIFPILSRAKYDINNIYAVQGAQIVITLSLCAISIYLNRLFFRIINPHSSIQIKLCEAITDFKNRS